MRLRTPVAALGLLLAVAAPARAADPVLPLSEVRAGLRCTGLSVIRGTEIAPFEVEVLDVIAGESGGLGPRILVRASGAAVEATGIGQGFSGSPILCPDALGVPRNAGAISESIGEYGNKVVLATPIEAILAEKPDVPAAARRAPALLRAARRLTAPLSVSGLSPRVLRPLAAAARRRGRRILAAPSGPLGSFAVQALRPGAAMGIGLASGDLSIGAIGTVAYVDGATVWGLGHPFEGAGRRSLLLQDAYVFHVVGNPNSTAETGTSYKLAAAGHDLGTLSNDALDAVVGRLGALPPSIPMTVLARDLDAATGRTMRVRVADERAAGLPTGSSALSLVGPLAVAQAGAVLLRGSPARQSGTLCVRFELAQRPRAPLRFCNRYVARDSIGDGEEALSALSARQAQDVAAAVTMIDDYDAGPLRLTGVEAILRLRRGRRQAFIRTATGPRTARPGRRIALRLTLTRAGGGSAGTRTIRLRLPAGARPGIRRIVLAGPGIDSAEGEAFDEIVGSQDEEAGGAGRGPSSLDALAAAVGALGRYDGISARVRGTGRARPVLVDPELRISGRATVTLRVLGRPLSTRGRRAR